MAVELVLVGLMVSDWRSGARRLAYPLSQAFFVAVHALMGPVSANDDWRAFTSWYAGLPYFV